MITQKYTITFVNYPGGIRLGYAEDMLVSVEIEMELSGEQHEWFWSRVPIFLKELDRLKNAKIKIINEPIDLSFEVFWDQYDYKVGKRSRAKKLWEAMSASERVSCLLKIKAYKFWLAHKNVDTVYPETWLSQRRWENTFKL